MAGVHRLKHVQGLGATDLADHDPVGPHAQRVPDQVADRDLSLALDVRRPGLQADAVRLLELELGRVLDRQDPLVVRDERGDHVERRGLPGARPARDQDVDAAADARLQELRHR